VTPAPELPTRAFGDAEEWESWLREHHDSAPGVWIKFARKGSGVASVTYMLVRFTRRGAMRLTRSAPDDRAARRRSTWIALALVVLLVWAL